MHFVLGISAYWRFVLIVGLGATCALDLWCLLMRVVGVVIIDWGIVGRRLIRLWVRLIPSVGRAGAMADLSGVVPPQRPGLAEIAVGRSFRYGLGMFYALLLPLIWGRGYIAAPTLIPAILIGFCLTSLLGQIVCVPLLGQNFFHSRRHTPEIVQYLVLGGHAIFAMSLYIIARSLAGNS